MELLEEKERLGVFRISLELIKRDPEAARKIMAECIVVRAEFMYYLKAVEYHAISDRFEEIKVGQLLPEYTWIWDQDEGLRCERKG